MGDIAPYFWISGCELDEASAKEVLKKQHPAFTAESEPSFYSISVSPDIIFPGV